MEEKTKRTGRDVSEVTQKIINEIPDSEVILKTKLFRYISSLWNLAPEVLVSSHVWIPVQDILNAHITIDKINEPWVQKTIRIFNDKNE
jgi:hypothetical protein